jgi:hypothetical protein
MEEEGVLSTKIRRILATLAHLFFNGHAHYPMIDSITGWYWDIHSFLLELLENPLKSFVGGKRNRPGIALTLWFSWWILDVMKRIVSEVHRRLADAGGLARCDIAQQESEHFDTILFIMLYTIMLYKKMNGAGA